MKLLFDHNLSYKLVARLVDLFPESVHVRNINLHEVDDQTVWEYARANGFAIGSKDEDFHQLSFLYGAPPKVVWVKPAALHVTIRFLGEVEEAEAERLQQLIAPPIPIAPFEVTWRGIGAFPSNRHPRALWLGVINGAAQLALIEAESNARREEL